MFPIVHGVRGGGVGNETHAPPHGLPLVQTIVGVHVLPPEHGALLPMVQGVRDGGAVGDVVGVAMHCPPTGWPGVEYMVGVQVLPDGHGALLPTVHGMTGGKVGGGLMHRPPQR